MQTGVILGIHKSRQKNDFSVLLRVTGNEYPSVNVAKEIREHLATNAYAIVWFVPFDIPEHEIDPEWRS